MLENLLFKVMPQSLYLNQCDSCMGIDRSGIYKRDFKMSVPMLENFTYDKNGYFYGKIWVI